MKTRYIIKGQTVRKIDEKHIFNAFHKYTYKDIKNVDESVHNIIINGISDDVCRDLAISDGLLVYLSSVLEYFSYNIIPVREEHALLFALGNGEVKTQGGYGYVVLSFIYAKNEKATYSREYTVLFNKDNVIEEVHYNRQPTITIDGTKYILGEERLYKIPDLT